MQPMTDGSSPQPVSPQPRSQQQPMMKYSTTSASGARDESAQSIIVMEEFDDDDDADETPQQHRTWSRSEDPHHHHGGGGGNDVDGSPLAPSYASSSLPGSHNVAFNGKHPTDRKKGAMEFIRALHAQQQEPTSSTTATTTTTFTNIPPKKPQQQQHPVVFLDQGGGVVDQTHISVSTVNDVGGAASATDTDNDDEDHHKYTSIPDINTNIATSRRDSSAVASAVATAQSSASRHQVAAGSGVDVVPSYRPGTIAPTNDSSNVLDTSEADSDRQAFRDMVKSLAASPDQSTVKKEGEEDQEHRPPSKNSEILKMFLNSAHSTTSGGGGGEKERDVSKQQPRATNPTTVQPRYTLNTLTANNVYSNSDSDSDSDDDGIVLRGESNTVNNSSRATGGGDGDDNTTMHFMEESHQFVGVAKSSVEPAYEPSTVYKAPPSMIAPPPPQQGGGKGGLNSSRPASRTASSSNLVRRGSTNNENNPHAAAVLERMKQKDLELQIKKENRARAAQEEADRECTFQPRVTSSSGNTLQPLPHSSDSAEVNGPQYDRETEAFASHRTAAIAHRRRLAERRQQQRFEEEKAMDTQLRNNTPKREAAPHHHQDPNNTGGLSYSKIHHPTTSSGRSLSPRSSGSSHHQHPPHSPTNNHPQQQQGVGSPTSAMSGRTYVFGTPQNRNQTSGVLRSETSTVDMINMTFQPSIGPRSRNVYVNGARGVEGTLDTFTRLYSRSMSYQLSNPAHRDTLKREEEARAAYRRVNLNETNAITVLEEGSPERRFLSKHLLDVLPVPLSLELDGLRNHFHLIRDKDIAGAGELCTSIRQRISSSNTPMMGERAPPQVLPPHFMVPFLCNSLGCENVGGIELVDTQGLGLNPAKSPPSVTPSAPFLRNRYSRKQPGGGGGDDNDDVVGSVLNTLCDTNAYIPAPTPTTATANPSSTPRRSQSAGVGGSHGHVPAVRTEASLTEFLQRQKSLIESKRRKTEELAKKLAPSGKPTLSKGTISISDRQQRSASARAAAGGVGSSTPARSTTAAGTPGRQQRELSPRQKREAELSKPRATPTKHYDTNLTFKPVISPFATGSIEGRTTDRMHEEGQRRTDRLEKLREASWKREQSQGATFKPKTNVGETNSRYGNVQSLLHPSNVKNNVYASYLSKRKLVREKLHEVQTVEAEEEDLRECTFRPAINPQPSYITKMAQNYSLLKKY